MTLHLGNRTAVQFKVMRQVGRVLAIKGSALKDIAKFKLMVKFTLLHKIVGGLYFRYTPSTNVGTSNILQENIL